MDKVVMRQTENYNPEFEEKLKILYTHIKQLNVLEKGVMLLVLEGKKYEKIAEITGLPPSKSYKEILLNYYKVKQNLLKLQRIAIFLSFILMFASSAVFAKVFGDKDFFMIEMTPKRYLVFGFAIAFVFFFSSWGFRVYKKITSSAENVLDELE